jgi:catechol 2,3-dioxygenase-like lactoylglutathione lyase family enzyme
MSIKIDDVAYVSFRAPDLGVMRKFLEDFGLRCFTHDDKSLFARGYGSAPFVHKTELGEPGFVELGLRARTKEDVEALAASEGVPVQSLDAPGGGICVRLVDPDGISIAVVAGQETSAAEALAPVAPWNSADAYIRRRAVKRVGAGPAHVMRLGHCVLNVSDFRKSEAWYKSRFGFITSDEIELGPEMSLGAFMRCDRGALPADHHTLFLVQLPHAVGFNHAAFEVRDFDDLMLGHDHLKQAERTPDWGVGRHILGSQVFDYWRDPWGHVVEHWTDGDLFTAEDGSRKASLADLFGVQWGSPRPPDPQ